MSLAVAIHHYLSRVLLLKKRTPEEPRRTPKSIVEYGSWHEQNWCTNHHNPNFDRHRQRQLKTSLNHLLVLNNSFVVRPFCVLLMFFWCSSGFFSVAQHLKNTRRPPEEHQKNPEDGGLSVSLVCGFSRFFAVSPLFSPRFSLVSGFPRVSPCFSVFSKHRETLETRD